MVVFREQSIFFQVVLGVKSLRATDVQEQGLNPPENRNKSLVTSSVLLNLKACFSSLAQRPNKMLPDGFLLQQQNYHLVAFRAFHPSMHFLYRFILTRVAGALGSIPANSGRAKKPNKNKQKIPSFQVRFSTKKLEKLQYHFSVCM